MDPRIAKLSLMALLTVNPMLPLMSSASPYWNEEALIARELDLKFGFTGIYLIAPPSVPAP